MALKNAHQMTAQSPKAQMLPLQFYTLNMKWISLTLGTMLLLASWLIMQIAKGYTFTYGLVTDLKSVAPFVLFSVFCFFVWRFVRESSGASSD